MATTDAEREQLHASLDRQLDDARERAREAERERIAWIAGTEPMKALCKAVKESDADAAMEIVGHLLVRSEAQISALQDRAMKAEIALKAAESIDSVECCCCESDLVVNSDTSHYCWKCWSGPWGLVERLVGAVDPALRKRLDYEDHVADGIVQEAVVQIAALKAGRAA